MEQPNTEMPSPPATGSAIVDRDTAWSITRREWFVSMVYQGMLANNESSPEKAIIYADRLIAALDQSPNSKLRRGDLGAPINPQSESPSPASNG